MSYFLEDSTLANHPGHYPVDIRQKAEPRIRYDIPLAFGLADVTQK